MSRPLILLDTDVASALFKGKPLPIFVRLAGCENMISFISQAEMKKWAKVRSWAPRNIGVLDAWLESMPTIHSTDRVTEIWADLSADGHLRGAYRPQNDTWIAAVALAYDLPLATFNFKDYADIEANHGLRLIRPRTGEAW